MLLEQHETGRNEEHAQQPGQHDTDGNENTKRP